MKNINNISKDLKKIIKKNLNVTNINFEKIGLDLHENWDSLFHFNLLLEIEKKFQIRFTMREMTNIKTYKDILKTIVKKKK
jgi:acyl carrier protein